MICSILLNTVLLDDICRKQVDMQRYADLRSYLFVLPTSADSLLFKMLITLLNMPIANSKKQFYIYSSAVK